MAVRYQSAGARVNNSVAVEALDWPVEVVIGSIREPSDFAGLPVVIDGAVTWPRRGGRSGCARPSAACCSWTSSPRRPRPCRQRCCG